MVSFTWCETSHNSHYFPPLKGEYHWLSGWGYTVSYALLCMSYQFVSQQIEKCDACYLLFASILIFNFSKRTDRTISGHTFTFTCECCLLKEGHILNSLTRHKQLFRLWLSLPLFLWLLTAYILFYQINDQTTRARSSKSREIRAYWNMPMMMTSL